MILFWKLQIKLVLSRYVSFHRHVNLASADHLQFNRPKALNSFGGKLIEETINAIRELNEHPDTVFTVLTGEGRFFSAGADIRGKLAMFTMAKYEEYQKT
jgi:enoyl-CoA hydratase/carnithine racemase